MGSRLLGVGRAAPGSPGQRRPSWLKKPPLSAGLSAASVRRMPATLSATSRSAPAPPMSVRTQPGCKATQTALPAQHQRGVLEHRIQRRLRRAVQPARGRTPQAHRAHARRDHRQPRPWRQRVHQLRQHAHRTQHVGVHHGSKSARSGVPGPRCAGHRPRHLTITTSKAAPSIGQARPGGAGSVGHVQPQRGGPQRAQALQAGFVARGGRDGIALGAVLRNEFKTQTPRGTDDEDVHVAIVARRPEPGPDPAVPVAS
jgi:hypothetical protein